MLRVTHKVGFERLTHEMLKLLRENSTRQLWTRSRRSRRSTRSSRSGKQSATCGKRISARSSASRWRKRVCSTQITYAVCSRVMLLHLPLLRLRHPPHQQHQLQRTLPTTAQQLLQRRRRTEKRKTWRFLLIAAFDCGAFGCVQSFSHCSLCCALNRLAPEGRYDPKACKLSFICTYAFD